ncbi:tRNA-uridine aminocarboxypropyltransferase [uncultured Shewanella sp.]|uniref:tRNA-uridine aminocarboxypropyltransferase n=1 Tax=uncultured Shewanella sp. TaxID=173975 RepID=UPI00261F8963|nr:tRNA-uridine aminocarboxypropyltransferase [uncultured Shewanella sp.]
MTSPLKIILLTHEREVDRPSNTGAIALEYYPEYCQRIIWSRVAPDPQVVDLLNQGQGALLFPDDQETMQLDLNVGKQFESLNHQPRGGVIEGDEMSQFNVPNVVVILDATWQEARKMCRRSDYLKQAMKYTLPETLIAKQRSQFRLRRNQVEGGFCTIECIQFLFHLKGMHTEAAVLESAFKNFNQNDGKIT